MYRPANWNMISNISQIKRWRNLSVLPDFFEECYKHQFNYIRAEGFDRKVFLFECESIRFQDKTGSDIWATTGSGEMMVPANVGVYIKSGKVKQA